MGSSSPLVKRWTPRTSMPSWLDKKTEKNLMSTTPSSPLTFLKDKFPATVSCNLNGHFHLMSGEWYPMVSYLLLLFLYFLCRRKFPSTFALFLFFCSNKKKETPKKKKKKKKKKS